MQKKVMIKNKLISYIDNKCDGEYFSETILFIHGNSCSSKLFTTQFNSNTLLPFRLIAIDLFGHGDSENLDDKLGYNIPSYSQLIKDFIHILNLNNVVLAGHSLGGHIAIETLSESDSERIKGIFIWGTPPLSNPPDLAKVFLPNPCLASFFKGELAHEEVRSLAESMCCRNETSIEEIIQVIKQSLPESRESLAYSVDESNFTDEFRLIEDSHFQIGIIYGLQEKIINPIYFENLSLLLSESSSEKIWRGKPIAVDSGHIIHIENSDCFNLLLFKYIEESRSISL